MSQQEGRKHSWCSVNKDIIIKKTSSNGEKGANYPNPTRPDKQETPISQSVQIDKKQ